MLNLQTIGASRFVGIFLSRSRSEKSLNIVAECLEICSKYSVAGLFEGIFIGAEEDSSDS